MVLYQLIVEYWFAKFMTSRPMALLPSLPACFRWCHMSLGVGGTRWSVTLRDNAAALIYFAKAQDGLAFLARWSVEAVPAGRPALAA
jgi:hypothetical protein